MWVNLLSHSPENKSSIDITLLEVPITRMWPPKLGHPLCQTAGSHNKTAPIAVQCGHRGRIDITIFRYSLEEIKAFPESRI
jgi:hypothetical protein